MILFRFSLVIVLLTTVPAMAGSLREAGSLPGSTDERPDLEWAVHSLSDLNSGVLNNLTWGDSDSNYPGMEWPANSGSDYLWMASLFTSCYGQITSTQPGTAAKWASISDYGDWEFWPSEGFPMTYQSPGPTASEESWYSADDWNTESSYVTDPYGVMVSVRNLSWEAGGYDEIMATEMIVTHHSQHGNPGVPLEGFVAALRGDCDVATADTLDYAIDDLVYYDGHAIWANGAYTFEFLFADGTPASTQDDYTYQQNPDSPLPPDDPDNIWYHYNYYGPDGIPDNDTDQNGVSDHFTILAKVIGADTLYITDPDTGIELFAEGMPFFHYTHVVGDTTYLVVPRNLSYMWDGDSPGSSDDDSGEQELEYPCNGFIGWRMIDFFVVKQDQTVERPADVFGYPIPLAHMWWNWESDPGTDPEVYDFTWGLDPDDIPHKSGPEYMEDWYGNPNTPEAAQFDNPGPFPIVYDNPMNLGYPVFDYRFLVSTGICTLEDGDELHIVGGWVIGRGLDGLRRNADLLLDAYYREGAWGQGLGLTEGEMPSFAGLNLSPNPLPGGFLSVNFMAAEPYPGSIAVYDLAGRTVAEYPRREFSTGLNTLSIDCSSLGSGMYFLVVSGDQGVRTGKFAVVR